MPRSTATALTSAIEDLNGSIIVDASGCPSILKKELKVKNRFIALGYQETLENSDSFFSNSIKIYYSGEFGYYWIFPRDPIKKEINVGVGIFGDFGLNLKKMLDVGENLSVA